MFLSLILIDFDVILGAKSESFWEPKLNHFGARKRSESENVNLRKPLILLHRRSVFEGRRFQNASKSSPRATQKASSISMRFRGQNRIDFELRIESILSDFERF